MTGDTCILSLSAGHCKPGYAKEAHGKLILCSVVSIDPEAEYYSLHENSVA